MWWKFILKPSHHYNLARKIFLSLLVCSCIPDVYDVDDDDDDDDEQHYIMAEARSELGDCKCEEEEPDWDVGQTVSTIKPGKYFTS